MSLEYLILPDARDDIDDAHEWYEAQAVGRGDQFVVEVHEMITDLRAAPEQYGFVSEPLRAAPLPVSKYVVYYTVESDRIDIAGVIHANADPRKWRRRI